jgi:hypothetical protein
MAGAGTGHALGDFQALDPPFEGHPLGRAPGQPEPAIIARPAIAAATPAIVSGRQPRMPGAHPMAWLPSYIRPGAVTTRRLQVAPVVFYLVRRHRMRTGVGKPITMRIIVEAPRSFESTGRNPNRVTSPGRRRRRSGGCLRW